MSSKEYCCPNCRIYFKKKGLDKWNLFIGQQDSKRQYFNDDMNCPICLTSKDLIYTGEVSH